MHKIRVNDLEWVVEFGYYEAENYGESPYFVANATPTELSARGETWGQNFITINRIRVGYCDITRRLAEKPRIQRDGYVDDYDTKNWRYKYEYIRRWGPGLPGEPTDAVKTILRQAAEKAILEVAAQVGDTKWKNEAKREYWTKMRDRQVSRMAQEQKELDRINIELLAIPLEIEHAPD